MSLEKTKEIRNLLEHTITKANVASEKGDTEMSHYWSTEVRGMLEILELIDTDEVLDLEFYENQLPS